MIVRWEASEVIQALPFAGQSLVQREVALCLIRRAPLAIGDPDELQNEFS